MGENTKKVARKIKTITCHDVYNFGASLQSFALMKYLQSLGHDVEIIDYKPPYMVYNLWAIGERWKKNPLLKLLFYVYVIPRRLLLKKRRRKFDHFTQNNLHLTAKRYHSNEELKDDPPVAHIYFAGSDQIWNTSHHNGKDPSFYLDFVHGKCIKASYAASFSITQIPDDYKEFVRSKLIGFDAISVRETSGLDILDSLQIEDGKVVMDPVFLLNKEVWDDFIKYKPNEKYIFIYDQENNPTIKSIAKRIASTKGYKIYAIESLYPKHYAHERIINAGPIEFLSLISNCEICLTNSFHATAFSLIFKKEFLTFSRMHEKVNSRMVDLLNSLDLGHHILEQVEFSVDYKNINYEYVSKKIENRIRESRAYIDTVLKMVD